MVDRYTQVTKTGYGKKVSGAFGGVLIGLILFIASFVLLFWNEGRTDMSTVAVNSEEIASETVDASADGKFISVSDDFTTSETLGDDYLVADEYLTLNRSVEMYAWEETTETEDQENLGGSTTTTTTYEYDTDWVNTPASSSSFEYPAEHSNPTKTIEDLSQKVTTANVEAYGINMEKASLPGASAVTLTEDNTILLEEPEIYAQQWAWYEYDYSPTETLNGNYIYVGFGTPTQPEVGDLRISYTALKSGIDVTAFGKLDGDALATYVDEDGNSLYRVMTGTREEALATMHSEHVTSTWILRVVGFVMMWVGLAALFGPISAIASFIPFLGRASRSIISFFSFIIAAVLSVITILISMFLHSTIALIIVAVIVVIIIIAIIIGVKKLKKKSPPSSPAPQAPPAPPTN